jgi:uncharacterized metal-binding protein
MPSGKVHSSTTIVAAATTIEAVIIYEASRPIEVQSLACFLLGLSVGLIMSPDLDLDKNINFSRLGIIWRLLWWPYTKAISHRSFVSHFPIISTIIRMLYIGLVPAVIAFVLGLRIYNVQVYWMMFIGLLGLMTSDIAHYYQDVTTSP